MTFARMNWKVKCAVILIGMILVGWTGGAFDMVRIWPHLETEIYEAAAARVEPPVYTTNVASYSVSWDSGRSTWP